MRRFGDPYKSGKSYRARPGAYAVLEDQGELLLTLQEHPVTGPDLQFPGGGIDPGESPLQALHRECLEEIGWRIAVRCRLGAFRHFTFMPEYDIWAEKICHIYLARPVRKIAEPTEPDHSIVWMPLEDAAFELHSPGNRAFAEMVLDHQAAGLVR